jgi:hypothetical protein
MGYEQVALNPDFQMLSWKTPLFPDLERRNLAAFREEINRAFVQLKIFRHLGCREQVGIFHRFAAL